MGSAPPAGAAHLPQLLVKRGGAAGEGHVLRRPVHGTVPVIQQLEGRGRGAVVHQEQAGRSLCAAVREALFTPCDGVDDTAAGRPRCWYAPSPPAHPQRLTKRRSINSMPGAPAPPRGAPGRTAGATRAARVSQTVMAGPLGPEPPCTARPSPQNRPTLHCATFTVSSVT
jgi:hypothetical protein